MNLKHDLRLRRRPHSRFYRTDSRLSALKCDLSFTPMAVPVRVLSLPFERARVRARQLLLTLVGHVPFNGSATSLPVGVPVPDAHLDIVLSSSSALSFTEYQSTCAPSPDYLGKSRPRDACGW